MTTRPTTLRPLLRSAVAGFVVAAGLAGCAAERQAPPPPPTGANGMPLRTTGRILSSVYSMPNGQSALAQVDRLSDGTIGVTIGPEYVRQRYGQQDPHLAYLLRSTQVTPANAACAPQRAELINNAFDERTSQLLSRWRCVP